MRARLGRVFLSVADDRVLAKAHGLALPLATTYDEAVAVAGAMGYTQTASWEKGLYVTTKPSLEIVARLEPFRMTAEKWWQKITDCGRVGSASQ